MLSFFGERDHFGEKKVTFFLGATYFFLCGRKRKNYATRVIISSMPMIFIFGFAKKVVLSAANDTFEVQRAPKMWCRRQSALLDLKTSKWLQGKSKFFFTKMITGPRTSFRSGLLSRCHIITDIKTTHFFSIASRSAAPYSSIDLLFLSLFFILGMLKQ